MSVKLDVRAIFANFSKFITICVSKGLSVKLDANVPGERIVRQMELAACDDAPKLQAFEDFVEITDGRVFLADTLDGEDVSGTKSIKIRHPATDETIWFMAQHDTVHLDSTVLASALAEFVIKETEERYRITKHGHTWVLSHFNEVIQKIKDRGMEAIMIIERDPADVRASADIYMAVPLSQLKVLESSVHGLRLDVMGIEIEYDDSGRCLSSYSLRNITNLDGRRSHWTLDRKLNFATMDEIIE